SSDQDIDEDWTGEESAPHDLLMCQEMELRLAELSQAKDGRMVYKIRCRRPPPKLQKHQTKGRFAPSMQPQLVSAASVASRGLATR
ncbi:unnamed protein product, partial [Symbiodinium microadriaticum]